MGEATIISGPDFAAGVDRDDVPEQGTLAGRVGEESVLLSRFDGEFYAVSGTCTHYSAALEDGLFEGAQVRCPLHHACFDLKTGAPLHAPALDPLAQWRVEIDGDTLFVRGKQDRTVGSESARPPEKIVIVGGGAAAVACANRLRKLGHGGEIVMISEDSDAPCDRPNLSKDFLAGSAPEEWIPLRPEDWYRDHDIDLRLGTKVCQIDLNQRRVICATGERLPYDKLLLATGAEPRRLKERGFESDNVLVLRSFADARALAARARPGSRAAILGSSFIGLEAAAALRARGVEVEVVSPEHVPFESIFGTELGGFLQKLHEDNGVRFHLGTVAAGLDGNQLKLANDGAIAADFVLLAVGVAPRIALADAAGLQIENGVCVDGYLETSAPGVYAAGDIAAYPDPLTGERVRIEHWVVAERQGETAAANMLGQGKRFEAVPFFWTEQYGTSIRYVGHAAGWDEVRADGEIGSPGGFHLRYYADAKHLASASVNRDRDSLEDELGFERAIAAARAESCGARYSERAASA